jgi:hypothetical protein
MGFFLELTGERGGKEQGAVVHKLRKGVPLKLSLGVEVCFVIDLNQKVFLMPREMIDECVEAERAEIAA